MPGKGILAIICSNSFSNCKTEQMKKCSLFSNVKLCIKCMYTRCIHKIQDRQAISHNRPNNAIM